MGSDFSNNSIVRFITCGSVDDGKSTLIGRLLLDSKAILEDQYSEIKRASEKKGTLELDLSLLTDGLKEEREKGITIDVAYRYFSTPKRKFIIADTPGHKEFTRNMFTGASTASVAILLVDVNKGISEQTMRHAYINSLLKIPHLIVCFNKMDLCNYEERIYEKLKKDFTDKILKHLEFEEVNFVPASALKGDNISFKSDKMPWYKNDSILGILENSGKNHRDSSSNLRFAIQNVYRNQNDMTIVMGRILAGNLTEGEYININSLNNNYKIEKLELKGNKIQNTNTGQSVSLFFRGDTLVNRGDIIFKSNEENIKLSNEIKALICWFSEKPIEKNKNLIIQTILQSSVCYISEIIDKFDINTYEKIKEVKEVITNDICTIKITTENQILEDYYSYNRLSGSLILVDNLTNEIVAGGIII